MNFLNLRLCVKEVQGTGRMREKQQVEVKPKEKQDKNKITENISKQHMW